ncbi:MAG: AAA family ATPase [Actinobacteria bacterium]|nr:AAA family ATPase [Actinomycetota bacterium]
MGAGLVTVVFVDVEPSTELLTRRGDAGGRVAINDVLGAVRERVEPYGGREVHSVGNGLIVVFPAPRQALAFAAGLQTSLAGCHPRLRIGVNTGEVVGPEDDVVEEVASAAAGMAAKAGGGEVLVSDVVRQLVASMPGMRFADRGRTRLKGFPDQWRLYAVAASDGDVPAKPVFGRGAELAALDSVLASLPDGSGRILILEGEAGIGKTHLVDALRARASGAGATVLEGGGDEIERDRPGRILLAVTDRLDVPLARLLRDVGAHEGSRGFAVVEAVMDAVEKAAAERPVVVVAEDLQWADELSLRGIAALARRVEPLPIALVATMRPVPRPPLLERVLEVLHAAGAAHLPLRPLDAAAVASVVASLTGAAPGPRLSARLQSTGGNPLFVVELVRALDHEGALRVAGGMAETDERALPANVRETVVRRLSSMRLATVEVLRLASLLGSEFVLADLATVSGQSVVAVAAHLHEAVDAGVLSGEGDTLSFRHDLIRESIYDDIVPAIRRDLHAAAGRALAAAGALPLQVARQFALGARPGDLAAVEWLERAAHETLALDPGTAVSLFQRALELAPRGPARWRIETALLEPLALSGRVEQARALAAEVLERAGGGESEFAARRGLAAALAAAGDLRSASSECEAAAGVAGVTPADARLLRVVAASMGMLVGQPASEARAIAEEALAESKATSDAALECWTQQALCLVALAEARYDDALLHARASREILYSQFVPGMAFLIPDIWEGVVLGYLDRLDEDAVALAVARERAERRGDTASLLLIHGARAGLDFFAGRPEDAASEVEAALALANETGGQAMTMLCHALAARFALGRGDLPVAEEHLAAGHQLLALGGHLFGADVLVWTQAAVLEAQGDPASALALLANLWDQTEGIRYLLQYRNFGPDLVRLARAAGDLERASAVAAAMEEAAGRSSSVSATAAALLAQGLARNDPRLLVDSVAHYRRSPRRMEFAVACEEAAAELSAAGDTEQAVKFLDEAAELYVEVGAARLLARVDAMLRACGAPRRRAGPTRATHGWKSLSPKEREVVKLVADGLSNPEIGVRLFISRRTVETHVSHAFRKLGVSNRAQLAAAAAAKQSDSK